MDGHPNGYDVGLVLLAFLSLLSPGISYVLWREWRLWKEERRRSQAEAESLRDEGYPPGRPTHHRPSKRHSR